MATGHDGGDRLVVFHIARDDVVQHFIGRQAVLVLLVGAQFGAYNGWERANWYARPGLTFAAQYYFKLRINDYDAVRDNTPNTLTSGDRYPGYITDQDFETNDLNFRVTWRARSALMS